jgi:hypothetical protein
VYLIPEDTGTPLYLARITSAYEDTCAVGSDRLCIEVRLGLRRRVVESDLQMVDPCGSAAGALAYHPGTCVSSHTSTPLPHTHINTQVQWYERRANMPANLQEGMHDREVVEWLQTDTNLVGCIERKARVVKARSYEEVRGGFGTCGGVANGGRSRRLLQPKCDCNCSASMFDAAPFRPHALTGPDAADQRGGGRRLALLPRRAERRNWAVYDLRRG